MFAALWVLVGSLVYFVFSTMTICKISGPSYGTSGNLGLWIIGSAVPTGIGIVIAACLVIEKVLTRIMS